MRQRRQNCSNCYKTKKQIAQLGIYAFKMATTINNDGAIAVAWLIEFV